MLAAFPLLVCCRTCVRVCDTHTTCTGVSLRCPVAVQHELMRMNSELDAKRRAAAAQRRESAAAAEAEMARRVAVAEQATASRSPPPGTPPRQASPVDTRQRTPLSPHVRAAAAASASKRSGGFRRESAGARAAPTDGAGSGPSLRVSPSPSRIPVGRGARGKQRAARAAERSPLQGPGDGRESGGAGADGADNEATIEGASALGLEAKVRYQRARLTVLKDERTRAMADKAEAEKEASALRRQLSDHEQEKVKLQRAAQVAESEAKREKKRAYVPQTLAMGTGLLLRPAADMILLVVFACSVPLRKPSCSRCKRKWHQCARSWISSSAKRGVRPPKSTHGTCDCNAH